MNRRALLALAPVTATLAACGLSTRAYIERREWPLDPIRPPDPGQHRGKARGTLLVRSVRAGPAALVRGLQTLQPDGSVAVGFYDEWLAPPADLLEAALREWLADAQKFAAVTAPGARLDPDLILDCELTALIADPAAGVARCDVAILLTHGGRVLAQRQIFGRAPLDGPGPPAAARALRAAAADALGQIEAALTSSSS